MFRKVTTRLLLIGMFALCLTGLSAPAAFAQSTSSNTTNPAAKPNGTTVFCWLPHDFEVVNPDATWCINGSGSVNILHVSKISNVDPFTSSAQVNGHYDCFTSGQSRNYSNVHVTDLVVGFGNC